MQVRLAEGNLDAGLDREIQVAEDTQTLAAVAHEKARLEVERPVPKGREEDRSFFDAPAALDDLRVGAGDPWQPAIRQQGGRLGRLTIVAAREKAESLRGALKEVPTAKKAAGGIRSARSVWNQDSASRTRIRRPCTSRATVGTWGLSTNCRTA